MTTDSEKAILRGIFGDRKPSPLEMEIFEILRPDMHRYSARDLAQEIYEHLRDNVIRPCDLLNYETYHLLSKERTE